jgi:uncharacterized protein (DUF1800 family)
MWISCGDECCEVSCPNLDTSAFKRCDVTLRFSSHLEGSDMVANPGMEAALALHRFGFGPRAGSIAAISADPRGAIISEIERPDAGQLPAAGRACGTRGRQSVGRSGRQCAARVRRAKSCET